MQKICVIIFLLVLCGFGLKAAYAERVPPLATKVLKLDEARWACALDLAKAARQKPLFSLIVTPEKCNGRTRQTMPPVTVSSQRPGMQSPEPAYLLKWMTECLVTRASRAERSGKFYVFDFEKKCN